MKSKLLAMIVAEETGIHVCFYKVKTQSHGNFCVFILKVFQTALSFLCVFHHYEIYIKMLKYSYKYITTELQANENQQIKTKV